MIIGINTTKDAVFIAETVNAREDFEVKNVTRLQFALDDTDAVADLLKNLKTILASLKSDETSVVAILCCCSGQYGSSIEAVKAEAIAQLAGHDVGLDVVSIKPQSLKAALGCEVGEKWQMRSKQLFNSAGLHKYWTQGADGAAAAAFKAAC